MHGGGGGKIGGRVTGEVTIPTTGKFVPRSIMVVAIVLWLPWGPTPGFEAYNNQQTYYGTGLHC
jgi:hypothetical protein